MKKLVLFLCAAALFASCRESIIDENVSFATKQIKLLVEASEQGDTVRIPSTYKNGAIEYVPTDDWVSGFFAGTLWYMYELTGDEYWAEHARKHTEILHDIQFLRWHHDVGFMINDSYGNGLRLKNIPGYDTVLVNTAASLATRFRPTAGIIQSWNVDNPEAWQSKRGWECPVIIDNMMNLELFFRVSEMTGDPTYAAIAVSHADKTLENHYRDDYSTFHVVDYSLEDGHVRRRCTAQGYSDDSAWARGQAWSIYGFTTAYRYTRDPRYLECAENVAEYLFGRLPEDMIPFWDFDCPDIPNTPHDVSSATIIASALYELSFLAENPLYKEKADQIVKSLSGAPYRNAYGEKGGFLFDHSVGSIPHGGNIDVPLNYADYYFLEALIRKRNLESGRQPVDY